MSQSVAQDPRRTDPNWINPNGVDWDNTRLEDMGWGEPVILTGTPEGLSHLKAGDIATVAASDYWGDRPLFLFTDGTLAFLDSTDPVEKLYQQDISQWPLQPHFEVLFNTADWNEGFEIADEPLASIPVDDVTAALAESERLLGFLLPNGKDVEIKVTIKRNLGKALPVKEAVAKALEVAVAHCDYAP